MHTKALRLTTTLAMAATIGLSTTACNTETTTGSQSSTSTATQAGESTSGNTATSTGAGSSTGTTTSPAATSTSSASPTGSGAAAGSASGDEGLMAASNTSQVKSIKTSNGWEGIAYKDGTIGVFTSEDGNKWTLANNVDAPQTRGGDVTLTAREIQDGHATFIVQGAFTGDDTGDYLVVVDGGGKWTTAMPDATGKNLEANVTGTPHQFYDASFQGGHLTTKDLWETKATFAEMKAHPIAKTWSPNGEGAFTVWKSNVVTAAPVKSEDLGSPKPPSGDGTFLVGVQSTREGQLTFTPKDHSSCTAPDANPEECWVDAGSSKTLKVADDAQAVLLATTSDGSFATISAPAWAWVDLHSSPDGFTKYRTGSSYVIPDTYTDITSSQFATVTVENGVITRIETVFHP